MADEWRGAPSVEELIDPTALIGEMKKNLQPFTRNTASGSKKDRTFPDDSFWPLPGSVWVPQGLVVVLTKGIV